MIKLTLNSHFSYFVAGACSLKSRTFASLIVYFNKMLLVLFYPIGPLVVLACHFSDYVKCIQAHRCWQPSQPNPRHSFVCVCVYIYTCVCVCESEGLSRNSK